jgi:hypothetical protein
VITGKFEILIDEVDELVEAISMRTAARVAALLGIDPDAQTPPVPPGVEGTPLGEQGPRRPKRLR